MSVPTFDSSCFLHALDSDFNAIPSYNEFRGCHPLDSINSKDLRVFPAVSLRTKVLSKLVDAKSTDAGQKALSLFLEMNQKCASFDHWENPSPIFETILGEVKYTLYKFFTNGYAPYDLLNWEDILANLNTGSKAALGVSGYTFLEKIGFSDGAFSTPFLRGVYESWISGSSSTWASAQTTAWESCGQARIIESNKLFTVPKRNDIDRCICVEPSGNMMFQKGIQSILERRLNDMFGIDLQTQQDVNRSLAKIGSRDRSFSTIDLSSASDTISMRLISNLLPKSTVEILNEVRSPSVELPDGGIVPLHMISSMGNAYTFPLQTLIFASVVKAVYKCQDIPFLARTNGSEKPTFGVNGDDIIVVTSAYYEVVRTLTSFGFIINNDKSFHGSCPFRESCGGDYLNGLLVRPVYIKRVKTKQDIFVAINLLSRWGARHDILLPETLNYLLSLLGRYNIVPLYEGFDAGVQVCERNIISRSIQGKKSSFRYQAYIPVTKFTILGKAEDEVQQNPSAILLSALRGDLRSNRLAMQVKSIAYRKVTKESPSWDFLGEPPHLYREVSLATLEWWQWRSGLIS